MRKIGLCFLVAAIAVSCNVSPPAPVPAPVPTAPAANAPQQDWTFTVTINGITHKAEGTYIYPHHDLATGYFFQLADLDNSDNIAYAPSTQNLWLSMLDKSESSYVSGDHIRMHLYINNLSLGVNDVNIDWNSYGTAQNTLDQLDFLNSTNGIFGNQQFSHTQGLVTYTANAFGYFDNIPNNLNTFPINITDLGTELTLDNQNYNNPVPGNTIKGNYSGTIYTLDTAYIDYSVSPAILTYEFNTPTQISINFEAIRQY